MLLWILMGLGLILCGGGLIWTWRILQSKKSQNAADGEVHTAIVKHTVALNPVFIAIISFFIGGIILIYIAYFINN